MRRIAYVYWIVDHGFVVVVSEVPAGVPVHHLAVVVLIVLSLLNTPTVRNKQTTSCLSGKKTSIGKK